MVLSHLSKYPPSDLPDCAWLRACIFAIAFAVPFAASSIAATLAVSGALFPSVARAQVDETRESLSRLEEVLALRLEEGLLDKKDIVPLLLVSARPHFERSRAGFPATVNAALARVLQGPSLRACEACLRPDVDTGAGRLEIRAGDPDLEELRALDARVRKQAAPARAAAWIDETPEGGVAVRVVSLADGRLLFADLLTPELEWSSRSRKSFSTARDLERRMRGESLTHAFFDVGVYPQQHIAIDWMEQWGTTNANLSGVSLSLFTPVLGVGPTYARAFPTLFNTLLGGKIMLSVPTALVNNISQGRSGDLIDPIVSGIGYARVPIPLLSGNYSGFIFAQIPQGRIGIGLSANNMSLLPVLP